MIKTIFRVQIKREQHTRWPERKKARIFRDASLQCYDTISKKSQESRSWSLCLELHSKHFHPAIHEALRLLYKDSWHLERYSQWVVFQKYVVSFIWGHQIKPYTYINMCLLESRGLRCQKQTKNTFLAHSSLEWISTSSDLAKVCRMNFY